MVIVNRLLHVGKSPISGITFTREALEGLMADYKTKGNPLFVTLPSGSDLDYNDGFRVNLDEVAGVVEEMYLDDEGLIVHTKLLETPKGVYLQQLLSMMEDEKAVSSIGLGVKISPNMAGKTETLEDGTVVASDLKLHSVRFEPNA